MLEAFFRSIICLFPTIMALISQRKASLYFVVVLPLAIIFKDGERNINIFNFFLLLKKHNFIFCLFTTVRGNKKRQKVNKCSSMTNCRRAEILIFLNSQHSYNFFEKNFELKKFVCLPFFCSFLRLDGQKRAILIPQVSKIVILPMMGFKSRSQIFCIRYIYVSGISKKNFKKVGNFKKNIF